MPGQRKDNACQSTSPCRCVFPYLLHSTTWEPDAVEGTAYFADQKCLSKSLYRVRSCCGVLVNMGPSPPERLLLSGGVVSILDALLLGWVRVRDMYP